MLEEKAEKLSNDHLARINALYDKIEKKINAFERGLKYKIEGLEKKSAEIHRLREYKEADVKNHLGKEIENKMEKTYGQQHKKLQKTIKEL